MRADKPTEVTFVGYFKLEELKSEADVYGQAPYVRFGRRLCENTNVGEADRKSFSNSPNSVLNTQDFSFDFPLAFQPRWPPAGHCFGACSPRVIHSCPQTSQVHWYVVIFLIVIGTPVVL